MRADRFEEWNGVPDSHVEVIKSVGLEGGATTLKHLILLGHSPLNVAYSVAQGYTEGGTLDGEDGLRLTESGISAAKRLNSFAQPHTRRAGDPPGRVWVARS